MTLRAAFTLERGPLRLDLDLSAAAGETRVLVGPNGAGKTSCLHALAGLLRIDQGTISLDGTVLDGGPGGPFVPPEARDLGLVFQEHRLFPRMSVEENVAYGLRSRGVPRAEARISAADWLERVGLSGSRHARPDQLSGGQAQRVALARALATSPELLLLDEPLAAVDASARSRLRSELRAHIRAFEGVCLVVAHDVDDALALADRITVVENGRITQSGTIAELAARPASEYVADLVGINRLQGRCRNGTVELDGGTLVVAWPGEGPVVLTVHPRAIAVFRQRPEGSPRNVWEAPIEGVEPSLDRLRLRLGGWLPLVAEITPAAASDLRLADGGAVWVALKATEIRVAPD